MPESSDDMLLDKLRKEDNDSYSVLYKKYFYSIANYIKKNSGSDEDAEDIFQDSIMILLDKTRQPDFILTSSLKTYLFSISKNLWLKKIRKDRIPVIYRSIDDFQTIDIVDEPEHNYKGENLSTWLEKITVHCQQILEAIFFFKEPMDSLMIKMGWKNKHTASNQKYKCIEQIRKERKNSL